METIPDITFHIKSKDLREEEIKMVLEEIKKSGVTCSKIHFEIVLD